MFFYVAPNIPVVTLYRLKSIYQILFHDRKTKQLGQIDMRFANLG